MVEVSKLNTECSECERLERDLSHFLDGIVHVASKKFRDKEEAVRELRKAQEWADKAEKKLKEHSKSHGAA